MSTLVLSGTGAIASAGSTSTAAAPALPASVASGDLLVMFVTWKQKTATLTTPAGWTRIGSDAISANNAAYAASAGDVVVAAMWKQAGAGEVAPTIAALTGGSTTSTTGNVMQAWIHRIATPGAGWTWSLTCQNGLQSTSTTSWSVAAGADPTVQGSDVNGTAKADLLLAGLAIMDDSPNPSSITLTIAGTTGGTLTTGARVGSTTGADMGSAWACRDDSGTALTGTSSGATYAATMSATAYGAVSFVRVRALPSTQTITGLTGISSVEAIGSAGVSSIISPTGVTAPTITGSTTTYDFETSSTTGWSGVATSGGGVISIGTTSHGGTKSLEANVGDTPAGFSRTDAVQEGETITVTAWFRHAANTRNIQINYTWQTISSTNVGSKTLGQQVSAPAGTFTSMTFSDTAPKGSSVAQVALEFVLINGNIGEQINLDDVTVVYTDDAVGSATVALSSLPTLPLPTRTILQAVTRASTF